MRHTRQSYGMAKKTKTKPADSTDSPVAWFCVLERARNTDDYELAARANHELKRLGVDVRFRRTHKAAPA